MGVQISGEAAPEQGCCSSQHDPDVVSAFSPADEGGRGIFGCFTESKGCCRGASVQEADLSSTSVVREANFEESLPQLRLHSAPTSSASSSRWHESHSAIVEQSRTAASVSWLAEGGSYENCESLGSSLAEGDAVLVWGSWLAKHARGRGAVLPRRQQIPPEAICGHEEVIAGTPLLAVSYCWATRTHPDPEGQQLRLMGALLDRWLAWRQEPSGMDDSPHLSQDVWDTQPGLVDTPSRVSTDVAVLLDWCGLYQEPRSTEERLAFESTLRQVGRWFSHRHTSVWLLTDSPIGAEPYGLRGWTTFERAVSLLPAGDKEVLDMGSVGKLDGVDWPNIRQRCRAKRMPPLAPADFLKELRGKHFSWGRDRIILEDRYVEVFQDLVGSASEMHLAEQNWGDLEVGKLHTSLSSCTRLQRLDLCKNRIGDSGAKMLADALLECPQLLQSLLRLDLSNNEIGDLGVLGLANALPSVRHIQALGLKSNFIGDEGIGHLAVVLPSCQGLQQLFLCRNEIGDPGAGELAIAMPQCASLQVLDLSENEVSDVGAERLAAVLPSCDQLQRFELARNRVGDRGALRLAAALPKCVQLQSFGIGGHEVGEILGGGRIGDGGAGLLASALLRCEQLRRLDLSENQIGDTGTAQLAAAMPHCGSLADVDLGKNCIADGGAGRLAEAVPRCGGLDWLRLLGNPLGAGGEKRLVEAWKAAGKPEERLLCSHASATSEALAGYSGWTTWSSPSVAPEESVDRRALSDSLTADTDKALSHRTSL